MLRSKALRPKKFSKNSGGGVFKAESQIGQTLRPKIEEGGVLRPNGPLGDKTEN